VPATTAALDQCPALLGVKHLCERKRPMKTIVKAIESMLAQDATQQWTSTPTHVGPVATWNWN
jgi:hypothetical protein